jgi:hypothetical protein
MQVQFPDEEIVRLSPPGQQIELDYRLSTLDEDRKKGGSRAELKAELEQRCP